VGGTVVGEGGDIKICLPYDALIETDKGAKQIGRIVEDKMDCRVLSFNHEREEIEYESIQAYEQNPLDFYEELIGAPGNEVLTSKALYQIETEDGLLECTGDHPVWVEGRGYTPACDIRPGDSLLILR
jgi:intein/homing endonuclease